MKRALLGGAVLGGVLLCAFAVHAQTAGERITLFDVSAVVDTDASVRVTETIVYAFGSHMRHGIYRDIPISYSTSLGRQSIRLSNITVVDDSGHTYPFTTSRSGLSTEEIKIGDKDSTVTGTKTYVISYTVSRAIGYFAQYDELYWNVTGNGWQVPIDVARASVTLPTGVAAVTQTSCYEGVLGSTEMCLTTPPEQGGVQRVYFAAARALEPGEGLTVAVGFPTGVVYHPTRWQQFVYVLQDNWAPGLPVIAFFGMLYLWYTKGKDPRGIGTIIPEYDAPDGLTPLECAAVLHGRVPNASITAEIIYLATRGYVKITRTETKGLLLTHADYTLTQLKASDDVDTSDKKLLDALFVNGKEVTLTELKKGFYANVVLIAQAAMASVVDKGYFPTTPGQVSGMYIAAGCVCVIAACFIWNPLGLLAAVGFSVSGVIIMLFALVMPKVTKQGAIAREQIKGLRMYLEVAEKDRIAFHNAPEKNSALFEKLLPYAMVLGVEKQWAKQFEGIYLEPPSWYSDPHGGTFNSLVFVSALHSFTSSAAAATSAPRGGSGSGGGGFSGGGFGGGGGGSW